MVDIQKFNPEYIQNLIFTVRGKQVIFDKDLAQIYGVETKNLNRAVSRNIDRFPEKFRFQLSKSEFDEFETALRFQIGTLKKGRGQHRKYLPYAFTEQGVAMLSAVLRSKTAVNVSIQIMDAFVSMRKFIGSNAQLFQRLDRIELKQIEQDDKFNIVFDAIEQKDISPKQGIIFEGQIFDAHAFVSKIIKSAKKSIILIDNYIDESVLTILSKRRKNVDGKIFTKSISKRLALDIKKFNAQYDPITVEILENNHDRFIIVDHQTMYHSGASLKDLGKKISAFSQFDKNDLKLLDKLK